MSWEFHLAPTAFAQHAADWDRLNSELYAGHPYFDSRFVGPLLEYFASGQERLCLYRQNGIVRAALILQSRGAGRWANFRPAQAQITPLLVADVRLLAELLRVLPGFAWSIELHAVDPRFAPVFSSTRGDVVVTKHARTIGIQAGLGFAAYWRQRPNNLRSNIRRYANRVEREKGGVTLACFIAPDAMAEGVRRFGDLESAGWKAAAGTAISIDNTQGRFYAKVLGNFAATGQAEVCELSIDGQLAASRLLIGNARMVVILKTTFDETLARFAPSRMLLYQMLEQQLTEDHARTVEFYTNATRDQAEWATFSSTIHNVHLFRGEGAVVAYSLLKALQRGLVRIVQPDSILDEDPAPVVEVHASISPETLVADVLEPGDFAPCTSIEDSLDWFGLLQRQVYPDDPNVRYYYVADRGRTTTILPLRLVQKGGVRTLESLSNYYTSLYAPLISNDSEPLALRNLLSAATGGGRGTHMMRFAPMDPESPGYAALLNALHDIGWIPLTFFCFGNWFLRVDGSWDGYLRKRSANLRSNIKRRNREFAAEGGTLELVKGGEGLDEAIAAFQEVYSASWKKPEPYPEFVPSLIHLLASHGMLRLGIARLQGRPIAAQLWIGGKGKASIYKVAYHHAYAALSPGTVLTSYLLRHVIEEDRVGEVDFMIGDDDYKKIWMSHRRERWGIVAFNPRTVFGCALMFKEVAGRIAKAIGRRISCRLSRARAALATFFRPLDFVSNDQPHFCNTQSEQIMAWTILPIEKFAEHASHWDALVCGRPGTPFLESAFLRPLLEVFGSGGEQLCLLHDNGRLRVAAIMQRGRIGAWQTFQPSQLPLGAWITDGQIDLLVAADSLLRQLPGVTLALGVTQVDPSQQHRPEDCATLRTQDYIATAWVDVEGGFGDYWEGRGKNLKQNTRKQHNKLQAEGIETRIECITVPEQVAAAIADYGMLEGAGWKGADGTAIAPDNAQGRFYRVMLENYCAQGRGRIYRYWFGDKVVAMDLCIHDDMVLVILKTAYDESYKSVSPSTLMRHQQFLLLFAEQKFRRIEFFGKVMEWHTRWTTKNRTIYHATAYRWAWLKALQGHRIKVEEISDAEESIKNKS